jgi:hemoglobin
VSQSAASRVDTTPYEAIGGEAVLRRLVDRFYDIMERDPAVVPLRNMHAADLGPMRQRLFEFMSGWLGGPRLYSGCVVGAHSHLKIGERERDQWLLCMRQAMAEEEVPEPMRTLMDSALVRMAGMFVSRDER